VLHMAWFVLVIAGLLEAVWALSLKYTQGFTRPAPSVFTGVTIVASMVLLARAARPLPIGTAYAAWVAIGGVGAVIGGGVVFGEAMPPGRVLLAGLPVVSIIGVMWASGG